MNLQKKLASLAFSLTVAVAANNAHAVDCVSVTSISAWLAAGTCSQDNTQFTIGSTTLSGNAGVVFFGGAFGFAVNKFDRSATSGSWNLVYTVTVKDDDFFISDMGAGADSPGGGSLAIDFVTGDPGGAFSLTVVNGVENGNSEKHDLTATSLTVNETFSVAANATLASVSNTFLLLENELRKVPETDTLALLAAGLLALGWTVRRRR